MVSLPSADRTAVAVDAEFIFDAVVIDAAFIFQAAVIPVYFKLMDVLEGGAWDLCQSDLLGPVGGNGRGLS